MVVVVDDRQWGRGLVVSSGEIDGKIGNLAGTMVALISFKTFSAFRRTLAA